MIGKIIGITFAVVLALFGVLIAGFFLFTTKDPLGWVAAAFGFGIFGIGASLAMIWMEVNYGRSDRHSRHSDPA